MQNAKRKVQNECVALRHIKIIAEGNTIVLRLALYTLHFYYTWLADLMSILRPVRRAARRAF